MKPLHWFLIILSFVSLNGSLRAEITLPAGTKLEVRLTSPLGSRISHAGDPVEAVLIAPVLNPEGKLLIAPGATVTGVVERVDRLGLGLKHLTASIRLHFRQLQFQNGETASLNGRVEEVETAREQVSATGNIGGINPTANFSTGMSFLATRLMFEPYTAAPALAIKFLTARSPDAEIYYAAGTELIVQLKTQAAMDAPVERQAGIHALSADEVASVQRLLQNLPEQQTNRGGNHPSDLVNVLFLGDREELQKTFHAAGWTGAQPHNVLALYRMFHCSVQRMGYRMAPMTKLTLNGLAPDEAYQKSLDTFAKRHHIRVWQQAAPGVWLGAATEDTGYAFRRMHMTHATDRNIDNERAKVVNDLAFTGCVDAGSLIPRDALKPVVKANSSIATDGQIAALRLNGCTNPRSFPVANKVGPQQRLRIVQMMSAIATDVLRSNPVSLGYLLTKSFAGSEHRRVKEYGTLAEAKRQKAEAEETRREWRRPSIAASTPAIVASNQ
jgi:hypothetical protein